MTEEIKYSFDTRIRELSDTILADYNTDSTMDRMDNFHQPDKEEVVGVLYQLLRLVYPGHYRERTFKSHSTPINLSALVEQVAFRLKNQIAIAITDEESGGAEAVERRAQEMTVEFFRRIPQVRAFARTDLQAAYDGDPAAYSLDEIIIAYPGLFAITTNRLAHELFLLGVPLIPRIMTEYAHGKTGIDIHPGATIGKHFFIDHGTGIVVGETTVIGEHVRLYQGVTLGALSTRGGQSLRGHHRHPTIEDNVTIYAGASILGGETVVGHDSVIGSNVFITASVKPGTRVSVKNQELDFGTRTVVDHEGSYLQGKNW